jgi:hypothetical protein
MQTKTPVRSRLTCGERIKAYENWTQARQDALTRFSEIGTARKQNSCFPKLFGFRETGTQVSPVTVSRPSPRTAAPPCLQLFIKDP